MDRLVAADAEDRCAEDRVGIAVDHDLHEALRFAFLDRAADTQGFVDAKSLGARHRRDRRRVLSPSIRKSGRMRPFADSTFSDTSRRARFALRLRRGRLVMSRRCGSEMRNCLFVGGPYGACYTSKWERARGSGPDGGKEQRL